VAALVVVLASSGERRVKGEDQTSGLGSTTLRSPLFKDCEAWGNLVVFSSRFSVFPQLNLSELLAGESPAVRTNGASVGEHPVAAA
jgi:hypothetical protein